MPEEFVWRAAVAALRFLSRSPGEAGAQKADIKFIDTQQTSIYRCIVSH